MAGLEGDTHAVLRQALAEAIARGVEHLHVEPGADGWRLRHRRADTMIETRPNDAALPDALAWLLEHLTKDTPDARSAAFTTRMNGETRLVGIRRIDGSGGPSFRLSLHGNAFAPPRLDALGFDAIQLRDVRELLQRTAGWIAVGAAETLPGERLVRALAQELVAPDRRLVCLEPLVHPPLARVLQLSDERDLVPCDALDADIVLLAATASDDTLRALAAEAAERLLVVQRCRARRPSDVLRRLLSTGLAPAWVALSCSGVLMHHRIRLVCHGCRVRITPEESDGVRRVAAPVAGDVGAWLERSLQTRYREGPGCERCLGTGDAGTREVIDLVRIDEILRAQLLTGNVDAALARIDAPEALSRRLAALAASGDVTDVEAALHLSGRRY